MIRVIFCFVVMMSTLCAVEMDSSAVLSVNLSDQGLTRISIEGDTIVDMFAHPIEIADHVSLHSSGHVFVVGSGLKGPVYLSLISSKGVTQDLKLGFANAPSKPLLLKPKESKTVTRDELERWMTIALSHETPRGFAPVIKQVQNRTYSKGVLEHLQSYSNGTYHMSLWKVRSIKEFPIKVSASQFLDSHEAGKLVESQLPAFGSTTLVIVSKNGSIHS